MKRKNFSYPPLEIFNTFKRMQFGLNDDHKRCLDYCPSSLTLNNNVTPKHRIAFLGDILGTGHKSLVTGPRIKTFLSNCDYLVGNFEATITAAPGPFMSQRHRTQILDALCDLFPPEKTFLGVANNHAADFGYEIWSQSIATIKHRGFNVFGSAASPYVDIGDDIRIIGSTQWSNLPCAYVPFQQNAVASIDSSRFNILFAHWGYELELYPRPEVISEGNKLIRKFDALVGHHSHCPQPVTTIDGGKDGINKLLAYSLGNFCTAAKMEQYLYGEILKIELGPSPDGSTRIGRLDWRHTYADNASTDDSVKIDLTDSLPDTSKLQPSHPLLRLFRNTRLGRSALPGRGF
jgi:hypothetical protein